MAPSKRLSAKKPKQKSKARQTTLSEFQSATTSSDPASTSTLRRSARGTRDNLDNSLLLPTNFRISPRRTVKKKPPQQQKLQLPVVSSDSPPSPPTKSPGFAVVIFTSPRKQQVSQVSQIETLHAGAQFDLGQSTNEKDETEELVHHDPRSSDEDSSASSCVLLHKGGPLSKLGREAEGGAQVVAPAKHVRQLKNNKRFPTTSTDESDDPITQARRRKVSKRKGKRVEPADGRNNDGLLESKGVVGEVEEDLEEDLAFLSSKHHVLPSRTRYNGSSPKKTPFQKKLEELRAKRAGKSIQEDKSSDDDRPKRALYDTDEEEEEEGQGDNDEDLENTNHANSDMSSDDESWIVEDDGSATIGAPDAQIPIQFTSLSHQSTRANFKICCTWIVQSILNPEFPLDDEISRFAFRALERRIDSYGGSVLQSSIWKAPFMRAMKARPEFKSEPCEERQTCDACDISGRTATFAATFKGPRYDKENLENLEGSDDDSEDSAGFHIPDESKVFYLGRHCHARAQMAHAFIHWKKQLREAIHGILDRQGYFTPYWNNRMAKMSTEERTRLANNVADGLGEIQEFYHDLRRCLEDAQSNMTSQRSKKWR